MTKNKDTDNIKTIKIANTWTKLDDEIDEISTILLNHSSTKWQSDPNEAQKIVNELMENEQFQELMEALNDK